MAGETLEAVGDFEAAAEAYHALVQGMLAAPSALRTTSSLSAAWGYLGLAQKRACKYEEVELAFVQVGRQSVHALCSSTHPGLSSIRIRVL